VKSKLITSSGNMLKNNEDDIVIRTTLVLNEALHESKPSATGVMKIDPSIWLILILFLPNICHHAVI
jgi:hypothetical protein